MSWTANFIGKPEKIADALAAKSRDLSGNNKAEFDAALPHLVGLLMQNHVEPPHQGPLIRLDASGSVSTFDGVRTSASCQVKIEAIYGELLL